MNSAIPRSFVRTLPVLTLAVVLITCPALAGTNNALALQARVDPRVELFSVIFRLAGNPEYNLESSRSPYSEAVERHFSKFRDHSAVTAAQALRKKYGISYNAVPAIAIHLTDVPELNERIPFDLPPSELDSRWNADAARKFLIEVRRFVRDTGFQGFIARHKNTYAAAADNLTSQARSQNYLPWLDEFFGSQSNCTFGLYVGMLTGGCNYGSDVRFPDGRHEVSPVIGASRFDAQGIPVFGDEVTGTVVHEFCHAFANPIIDKHAEDLRVPGQKIFEKCASQMKSQAYSDWKTMMYESMVRACTIRYIQTHLGEDAARHSVERDASRGFEWVGPLAMMLADYETNRTTYATLDPFMPRVAAFFQSYAAEYEKRSNSKPKVISMIPANGAKDVDPNLTEIKVMFDRPMRDQMWAVVGAGPNFPEIKGTPSYDSKRKVLTIPVQLKPDWEYTLWLNRGQFNTFRSAEGEPLDPVHVTFKTRAR